MSLVEKYRPRSFEEVVGQEKVVSTLKEILKKPKLPHFLFSGPAGTGKTTVAYIIARERFGDRWRERFIELNASDDRGIDVVREKIKPLARFEGERIIFLDEADAMTPDAQDALRRVIERSVGSVFILSCNKPWKIIDPIKSRCVIFSFNPISKQDMLTVIAKILSVEGVRVEDKEEARKAIELLVYESRGDLRMALNTLEKCISAEKVFIPENIIQYQQINIPKEAVLTAIQGDFEKAKNLIEDAYIMSDYNHELVFEQLFETINQVPLGTEAKARLYYELAQLESRSKLGTNPLIQLTAFISFCWIVKYLGGVSNNG